MNAEQFAEKLNQLNACNDARAWAAEKTLSQAWQECQKPEWMLWLLGRSTANKTAIATIAVEIAELSAANASAYPAVAECIAVVKRYLAGTATAEELSAAESAASAAKSAQCEIIRKLVDANQINELIK